MASVLSSVRTGSRRSGLAQRSIYPTAPLRYSRDRSLYVIPLNRVISVPKDVVARIHVATHHLTRKITQMAHGIGVAIELRVGLNAMISKIDADISEKVAQLNAHVSDFGSDAESNAIIERYRQDMNAVRDSAVGLQPQADEAAANLFAYNIALESLCTSLLQTARQLMVSVCGNKDSCSDGRLIGTQPLKNIIWQARNQAIHYDEPPLHNAVQNCFTTLTTDLGADFDLAAHPNQNLSPSIIRHLGWADIYSFEADMRQILNLP